LCDFENNKKNALFLTSRETPRVLENVVDDGEKRLMTQPRGYIPRRKTRKENKSKGHGHSFIPL
jgi:hypothetical protein